MELDVLDSEKQNDNQVDNKCLRGREIRLIVEPMIRWLKEKECGEM